MPLRVADICRRTTKHKNLLPPQIFSEQAEAKALPELDRVQWIGFFVCLFSLPSVCFSSVELSSGF